jgi:hypothetical protein
MPKTPLRGRDPDAPDGGEGRLPPPIPSFASLRSRSDRSGVDVLVPGRAPTRPGLRAGDRPVRPAEYRDLVRIGVHVIRRAAAVQERLLPAPLRGPWRRLRRLLDDVV